MEILLRDNLPRRRSAGVNEHRLIVDQRAGEVPAHGGVWPGYGALVYLADTSLSPRATMALEAGPAMDVVTVTLEGRVRCEGGPQPDGVLGPCEAVVLGGGGRAASCSATNPDDAGNRFIRLWLVSAGGDNTARAEVYRCEPGRVTRLYGGSQGGALPGSTCVDLARLAGGQSLDVDKPALVYVCQGRGFADEDDVQAGALLRSEQLTFDATEDACLLLIHEEP